MANWLSIQAAAEKYGVTEGVIREWIRLNYLTISSLKRDPFEDLDPLVDADELDRALELKSMQSYPDDETIERISERAFRLDLSGEFPIGKKE